MDSPQVCNTRITDDDFRYAARRVSVCLSTHRLHVHAIFLFHSFFNRVDDKNIVIRYMIIYWPDFYGVFYCFYYGEQQ